MDILAYIIPTETVLKGIIGFMILLAFYVIYQGQRLRRLGKANLKMLEKLTDVSSLEQAVLQNKNHDQAFKDFEDSMGRTDKTSILFEHVKAIYDAGIKSSRLDADLLVQNTVDKIFAGVDSLKTTISIFLVVGILGTLFGLAISIGGFSGNNFLLNNGQASETANALSNLFMNLRGAFAPSMWGVAFTIVFVLLYSWAIQEGCVNKFKERLTITTIRNWLPKLYPTDFQRGDKSIVKLNAVISNAEGINQGVTDLEKNLSSSNETLRQLAQVSVAIDKASNRFDQSTSKIVKLQKLYEEIQRTNATMDSEMKTLVSSVVTDRKEAYQEYLALANDQNSDLQKRFMELQSTLQQKTDIATANFSDHITELAKGMGAYFAQLSEAMKDQKDSFGKAISVQNQAWQRLLEHQERQLAEVIQQLKSYDTNFFQVVNDSRAQLTASATANDKALKRNEKLADKLEKFGDRLSNQQDEIVKAIQEPIVAQLNKIAISLNGINDPLQKVTLKMQKMLETNHKETSAILESAKQIVVTLQQNENNLKSQQETTSRLLGNLQTTLTEVNRLVNSVAKAKGVSVEDLKKTAGVQSLPTETPKENVPFVKKHLVTIVIAVLLFFSMITQVVMVTKISNMQQTQTEVNQILLKGDMNNSSSGSNP